MQGVAEFLSQTSQLIEVELSDVQGSSPRDAGTVMYVAPDTLCGTIGGGQLEFMAIERARAMLSGGATRDVIDIPLGPEIGQCCGGRVTLKFKRMGRQDKQAAFVLAQHYDAAMPHIYILGAGHVGRALADQLQYQPARCILIDTRKDQLAQCTAKVETRLSALPEIDIQDAPAGSAFVVLTHDHALDFLLTSMALARKDAAYVGMIGSDTKRAKFAKWCEAECDGQNINELECPIGAERSADKRPNVIAAFVAAEVMAVLTSGSDAQGADASPAKRPAIQQSNGSQQVEPNTSKSFA